MLKKYKLRSYNFILVFILIITSVFALAVVNSANSAYTMKQGAGMVVSFVIMIIVSFIDYNWILKYFWIWCCYCHAYRCSYCIRSWFSWCNEMV